MNQSFQQASTRTCMDAGRCRREGSLISYRLGGTRNGAIYLPRRPGLRSWVALYVFGNGVRRDERQRFLGETHDYAVAKP